MQQATTAVQTTPNTEDEFHGLSAAELFQLAIEMNKNPAVAVEAS